ncbi:MAG: hypothetical protein A2136_04235 [Chloroflexi bacterium RBG_16_54_11]|nr:MAG: hypothetical protein A2136_04235 [Chloroflexi bacterium RBG_16_54_11]
MTSTLTDAGGSFAVTFQDIPGNGRGYIRFIDLVPPTDVEAIFHRQFYDLQPTVGVNYAHEWVEGQYDPGYQVWITVTDSLGEVKATAQGVTGEIPYWNGETGFATHYNTPWNGAQPDMQVGDHVYVMIENGYAGDVRLGEIGGVLDTATDIFEGYLNVPWLVDPVNGDCGVWVDGGPGMGFENVDPNGGTFTCDFSGIYDILPGMEFGVAYNEPDADRVLNVFQEPAPDLRINVWGQGTPASGNNYILEVHYNNDGWATAPGVTIQQELWGMVYLSDTSGFVHSGSGNPGDPLVWDVGALPVNRYGESMFYVFVNVVNPPLGDVFTSASIDSSMDYYQNDEGRKHSDWGSGISEFSDSDLNLGKWAWTGDPVPGQDFVYVVNVCNNSGNASSQVTVTDTLPITTTLVSWWGQQPGWEVVLEDPHELVVTRPTVSGNQCSEVYIKVNLSSQINPGDYLRNDACVGASSDPNPGDNCNFTEVWAGNPSYNMHMDTNWTYGQFVPGGEVGFEFGFTNWGNMPMPGTVLTTTLPEGTEYLTAYTWNWSGWIPFTPTVVGEGYLVWDVGTFPNGYRQDLGVRLRIDEAAPVGMPLVMENSIMGDELEYRYDDNILVYTEAVQDFGPNLRVDKHTNWWWNDWWEGEDHHQQIWYELRILNVGTQFLDDPVVVDTYPVSTTIAGCWWNHGPFTGCEVDEANHQVTYYLDGLNEGETASAMFVAELPPELVGVQGQAYFNQVDISDFGDVAPEDNHDEVTAYTGPDTFVRKWLKEGEVQSGRTVTYTVEFGNQNKWPWDSDPSVGSHITETLPAGMTFVEAIGYWDPATTWEPESVDGQQIVWGWGPMWANQTWTFDLVVQVDDGLLPGVELLNTIDAWGDNPSDFDIDPSNNHFEYSLYTVMYRILMPFMLNYP